VTSFIGTRSQTGNSLVIGVLTAPGKACMKEIAGSLEANSSIMKSCMTTLWFAHFGLEKDNFKSKSLRLIGLSLPALSMLSTREKLGAVVVDVRSSGRRFETNRIRE
jgi:hypothetical protein